MNNHILTSILITILTGVFLQMTWIVGIQNLVFTITSDITASLFADFGFRMVMGAVLVFLVVPLMLGYYSEDASLEKYVQFMRVKKGTSFKRTILVGMLPFLGFILTMLLLALSLGIFNPDFSVLIVDYKWFMFILALVPGIWEELAFRGVMLSNLEKKFSPRISVLISALLFGLFHFSNLVKDDITSVIALVIMATSFGIGWGYIVINSKSVLPVIFIHYTVDVFLMGPLFIDSGLMTDATVIILLLSLTIVFPIICLIISKILFPNQESLSK